MRMQGYSPREFTAILNANGWHYNHHSSNHMNFSKDGCSRIITVSFHGKEINRCIAKRLLKEANICI
jgi:predicted RNA binding protein YcfA (HicA-like mRNA interferase family)